MTTTTRWEDDAQYWQGPYYETESLAYHPSVKSAAIGGRIITAVDVVDWSGTGTRDLLLSAWDACYDGCVFLHRQIGTAEDGTPLLGGQERVEGIRGFVTSIQDGDIFHLVSASRLRSEIYFYRNIGRRGEPEFDNPQILNIEADWVRGNEYIHLARFQDIDRSGVAKLMVGTDYWDDYWPNGLEWNETGYRGYDSAARWLGGPLRGFLYVFENIGTPDQPRLQRGKPVLATDGPFEVYGQLSPSFGQFGQHDVSLVAGEFWNILHLAPQHADGTFDNTQLVSDPSGQPLELDHCINIPCVNDWNGDGQPDILVAAEDGYVSYLQNVGDSDHPCFTNAGRIESAQPRIHAGVLPSPAAYDFTGSGRPDLVVGNSAGELLYYQNSMDTDPRCLQKEIQLTAAGHPIRISAGLSGSIQGPSEKLFGYTCPTVADWTGTGQGDLLIGDVTGYHSLFRNLSKGLSPPRFGEQERLCVQGKPLKTVWRVKPAVIRWAVNDQLHYVTLDEFGVLSDWRKINDTELAEKRQLCWENGAPIRFTQDEGGGRGRVKICLCDWEGTGRTDLIFGTHARANRTCTGYQRRATPYHRASRHLLRSQCGFCQ